MILSYIFLYSALLLIILLLLSAFFSGSETALFSLSRARLLEYANSQDRKKRIIALLMRNYKRTLLFLILANMFVNVSFSVVHDEILEYLNFSPWIRTVVTLISSVVLILIFGEVTPKVIAISNAEKFSQKAGLIIYYLQKVFSPLTLLLEKLIFSIMPVVGSREDKSEVLTGEEYISYIESASKNGIFSEKERTLLSKALLLRKKHVKQVMTPITAIPYVTMKTSVREIGRIIRESRKKYILVKKVNSESIVSILSASAFFAIYTKKFNDISEALIDLKFIPESANLISVLSMSKRENIAVMAVVDEYGAITGIIETEQIYEELIGEIRDEYESSEEELKKIGENMWIVSGSLSLEKLHELVPLTLSETERNSYTINGFFLEKYGKIPEKGESIKIDNIKLTALEVRENRIIKLKIEVGER